MNIYERRLRILAQTITFIEKIYTPEQLRQWIDVKTSRIGIPQFLWRFRKSLKLSEDEFAQLLGLNSYEYKGYECIGAVVPESLINLICEKYRLDRDQLNFF